MSRLLFAAARGARIEVMDCEGCWVPKTQWGFSPLGDYRSHPDDEHLQYGPISSALRAHAVYTRAEALRHNLPDFYFGVCLGTEDERVRFHVANELHRSLFLLILAEALADEGL